MSADTRIDQGAPATPPGRRRPRARWLVLVAVVLVALIAGGYVLFARTSGDDDGWNTVWREDFDGSQGDLPDRSAQTAQRVHQKAWRWVAEMRFIGESMAEAGLPPGFHDAAADIFAELVHLKGDPHDQDPEHVFDLVRTPKART